MRHSHRAALGALAGVLLLLYGSGAIVVSRFADVDTNLLWWAQVLGVCIGGVSLIGWAVYSLPKTDLVPSRPVDRPQPDVRPQPSPTPPEVHTDELDYEIIQAIHLLSRRMRETNHAPGLELCRQLHDHLFAVEYKMASSLGQEDEAGEV